MTKNLNPKSRTRERKSVVAIPGSVVQTTTVAGKAPYVNYQVDRTKFFPNTEVMSDVVTPGFAVRQANGELVNNPMSKALTTYSPGGSGATFKYVNGSTQIIWVETGCMAYHYHGAPTPQTAPIDTRNLEALAQTAALASVKTSNFMGLVALAEARKTIAMLANPLGSISSLLSWVAQLRAARKNLWITWKGRTHRVINGRRFSLPQPRGKSYGYWLVTPPNGSTIVKVGEAISGTVLALDLGLYPFLCDIEAILKDIPKAHQYPRETFRAMRTWQGSQSSTDTLVNSVVTNTFKTVTDFDVKVRATVVARDRFDISSDFGVSLWDVPEAGWELVPYSFLVDYLLNVGDFLSALRASATRDIELYCTAIHHKATCNRTWVHCSIASPWTVVAQPGGTDMLEVETKSRNPRAFAGQLAYTPIVSALTPGHIKIALSLATQRLVGLANPSGRKINPFR